MPSDINTQPIVSLQRCSGYIPENVDQAINRIFEDLGGLGNIVKDKKVLLKPNFLVPRSVNRAVTTHPEVVRAVAQAALEAGAKEVSVADSPAVGRGSWVAKKSGVTSRLKPLGVKIEELNEETLVHRPGAKFPKLHLARKVVEADVVINLAKLKTHGLCGMTMAVKNCFGAIVGLKKTQWHLRAGKDRELFATMLIEVCKAISPAISIVDAIDSMDGNGPGSGRVRKTNFLAGGNDPFVLDRLLAKICRVPAENVTTFGPDGNPSLESLRILGESPKSLEISDWKQAVVKPHRHPRFPFFRKPLVPLPRFSPKKCNLCQQCVKICPKNALSVENDKLQFQDNICISCFCCQELCPEGAVTVKKSWLF
jgi:uncharacterized protein (DUF362 family)/Pyruvate/2-oxoacid:ferredoxin oxidoreductase delta subunit